MLLLALEMNTRLLWLVIFAWYCLLDVLRAQTWIQSLLYYVTDSLHSL